MSLVREIKQKQKGFDRQCAKINIRKKKCSKTNIRKNEYRTLTYTKWPTHYVRGLLPRL